MGHPESLASTRRFPDGGAFRIEIPSVEGPDALHAVIAEARGYGVRVHRVSQGSGIAMLADDEIREMLQLCEAANIELCLFLGPRGNWSLEGGSRIGARVHGKRQLGYSIDDAQRAVELGASCLLVADEGVLWSLHQMRQHGELPSNLRLKMSALSGPANPASFAVVEGLGADSINVPSDLSLADLGELRVAGGAAIDFYVEAPDGLGGYVRHHDAPAIVTIAAPVYLKFGLRNCPELYPVGLHLREVAVAAARERVRRAHLALELLERHQLTSQMSPVGATEIGTLARFPQLKEP